jgi:hypothetical protein
MKHGLIFVVFVCVGRGDEAIGGGRENDVVALC